MSRAETEIRADIARAERMDLNREFRALVLELRLAGYERPGEFYWVRGQS